MTESPIAVTCRPDTFGSFAVAIRHADAGAGNVDAGNADAGDVDAGGVDAGNADAGDADGPAGTAPEPVPWELA
jgi:hypothetical protein